MWKVPPKDGRCLQSGFALPLHPSSSRVGSRSIGRGGREGGRTLILPPSLYSSSSPSASLSMRSMSLPQPKDIQEREGLLCKCLFLLISMCPAHSPVNLQRLPTKLCTKCNFCRKIQFKGSATMRQERKAPYSSSSCAHKANSTPSSLKMEEVGTTLLIHLRKGGQRLMKFLERTAG